MSRFDEHSGSLETWQDIYARLLRDLLEPEGFQVFSNQTYEPRTNKLREPTFEEARLTHLRLQRARQESQGVVREQSLVPRQLRVVFIERDEVNLDARLPDGLDLLLNFNLSIFSHQVLDVADFNLFASYAQDYATCRGISNLRDELGLFAVAPRVTDEVRRLLVPVELMPGLLECGLEQAPRWRILLTREMTEIRENLLWRLLSFDPPKVREALRQFMVQAPQNRSLWEAIRTRMVAERLLDIQWGSNPPETTQPLY
jgi:hypothetical protein